MKVKSIELENFRNYTKTRVDLSDGLNVLVGNNAQGKTNLIEALYLLAIGKSPRTNKDKDLINWKQTDAIIRLELEKKSGTTTLEMRLNSKNNKVVLINNMPIHKISEILGNLNAIYFFPDDLKLIKDAPQDRRRFLDIDISQASKNYFYLLSRYNQILNQRNKLLKNTTDINILKQTIGIWDEQLATVASKIILSRIHFIDKLAPYVKECHKFLTDNKEELVISYQGILGDSGEEIKNKLLAALNSNLEKDFTLGYTSIGPHRDDIKIMLNGIDVRSFGSQGQQRTASLAMKLAEVKIFEDETKESPLLLLDDVLSELDRTRQEKLIAFAKRQQTLLTCTEFNFSEKNAKIIKIDDGKII